MRAFVDNCISPTVAATLNGFLDHSAIPVVHIKDAPCGRHATDLEWIEMLRSDREEWLVFTGDTRIQKNRAERLAFRQAGLRGIVLAPAYQSTPINQQVSFILWRWPDLANLVRLTAAPFMFEVPMHRTSRIRQLPL